MQFTSSTKRQIINICAISIQHIILTVISIIEENKQAKVTIYGKLLNVKGRSMYHKTRRLKPELSQKTRAFVTLGEEDKNYVGV